MIKKIIDIFIIIGIGLMLIHFFVKDFEIPTNLMPVFLSVFFLLIGIGKVLDRQVWQGYFLIGTAVIMGLVMIKALFENLL
ncbi:hypothetical protein [Bacillus sp. SG-1]|uniref:hypothetical protein n=1 Tax=Bacillus sp. SG-1 TaxID=161544 RepID=UPI0005C48488|nr:hypothetical protein [Bacillus sp. SG-1]